MMMYCGRESRYWNERYPPVYRKETLEQLRESNRDDLRLYRALTDCGTVVFPEFDPARFAPPPPLPAVPDAF